MVNQENLTLVRHLCDRNLLRGNFCDAPLIPGQEQEAESIAKQIVSIAQNKKIIVFTSNKIRALETTDMLFRFISNEYDLNVDDRIRELDQGKYILPDSYKEGDFFPPLQKAWNLYFEQTFKNKNYFYRFADPLRYQNCKPIHEDLDRSFYEYGENQNEFSIRYLSFLVDLLKLINSNKDKHFVIVTHQAIIARIIEFTSIYEYIQNTFLPNIAMGTFQMMEWEHFKINKINQLISNFAKHGASLTINFGNEVSLLDLINSERDVLIARRTQEHNKL